MIYFISALIFIAVFTVSAKILEAPMRRGYCSRLLSESNISSTALPAKLSLAVLPKWRIFRSVSLPIPGKDGQEIQLGTVIVSRSGVFIICQINGAGILENSHSAKWKRIHNGKFTEFDNPFVAQSDARTLIEYYAEAAGYPDIKAHSLVIYTNSALRFTNPKPRGVMYAKDFATRLLSFEKRGRLSTQQIKAACSILKDAEAY